MKVITAPNTLIERGHSIFLAGGITNCPDWQTEAVAIFKKRLPYKTDGLILLNPRRENFDAADTSMTEQQIRWEFAHLRDADSILFWFPKESVCPIALFELGRHIYGEKNVVVGCDPEYPRAMDLDIQLGLLNRKVSRCLRTTIEQMVLAIDGREITGVR